MSSSGASHALCSRATTASSRPGTTIASRSPADSAIIRGAPFMSDQQFHVDGARVLADLNTLRGIGAYKTGVHKPTFSEPHLRSLDWLVQQLPEAELAGGIDGIGNLLGISRKQGLKLLADWHLESQN